MALGPSEVYYLLFAFFELILLNAKLKSLPKLVFLCFSKHFLKFVLELEPY